MKQPDRFEQKVALLATDGWSADAWCISDRQAIACLRGEHAALVRAVKRLERYRQASYSMLTDMNGGEWLHRREVLALLAQRREGTR